MFQPSAICAAVKAALSTQSPPYQAAIPCPIAPPCSSVLASYAPLIPAQGTQLCPVRCPKINSVVRINPPVIVVKLLNAVVIGLIVPYTPPVGDAAEPP